ncbi:double-strand break repair protein AddB [uncultured Roseibium sp.]|uniref:double-strand break repair protein AddB n=1 Tax=uncultured Roseibium sp. TaxID=1936171 RepID=UPI0026332CB7|nr:double-strand break repair protein AddB [uncultured Roseibium sp.]
MGERPRLFTVPSSVPFLKTLVDTLVDGSLLPGFLPVDDPLLLPKVTLYLPTRRAARLLPELFQQKFGGKPVLLPVIRPVGDADEDVQGLSGDADLEPLPPAMPLLERHLAMTRLVKAWKGMLRREALSLRSDEPLGLPASTADAAWLAADLLTLMDEVETEEADWSGLGGLVPEDHARYWQITLDFLQIVQTAWPAHLAELGRMDPKARRSALIRREAERLRSTVQKGPVIVAGVTGSVPATAELLKVVAGLDQGVIVLPGLDHHLDERSWAALGERQAPALDRIGAAKPASILPSHPQYSLKQLLIRLKASRADVIPLRSARTPELQLREELVSEALRPADTSDGWTQYLQQRPEQERAKALRDVAILTARNEADEALSVAIALREAIDLGQKAALISADRMLTRRVAAELARWNVQVDDSAGRPLDQTAPAVLAILAAKLALEGCEPIDLLALLKHPLARLGLKAKDIRSAARALERGVLRGPRARPGTAGLKLAVEVSRKAAANASHVPRWKKIHDEDWDVIAGLVDRLSTALEPLEEIANSSKPLDVTELARRHVDILQAVAVDEAGSVDELFAGEAGEALAGFLTGLLDAGSSGLEIVPREWSSVLPALMSGEAVRRRVPGDLRVQILGPMEARLQSFDFAVLGGLNEGVWPQRTRNDPWLNRPMKRDMGLEPPERRLGAAAHDFSQGIGAGRVLLTRAARADGAPTVASRWLQRLTTLAGPNIARVMEQQGARYTSLAGRLDRPPGNVTPAARPRPCPPLAARPKSLSITEIERLIRDPYAVFVRHVLDLQPVEPIGGEPGAADKGNLVHDALANFLASWKGPFDSSAIEALLEIGEELFQPLDAFPAIRALWWPRFQRIAAGFVGYEAIRSQTLEKRYLEIGGGVDLKLPGFEFGLRGRADRIDLLDGGGLAVIDYKTGQVPSQKQVDALLAPQLPLEAAMIKRFGFKDVPADAPLTELLYLQLKGGLEPVIEILRNPKDLELADLAEDAWMRLEQLIAHYADEKTGYLSRARVMRGRQMDGDFDHLARTQEWALGGDDPA